jgi:NhaA family Na+:H+ antiporter
MKKIRTKAINFFNQFIQSEQSSGIILIACTVISLSIANSPWGIHWENFWHIEFGPESLHLKKSLSHWVDDGLMTLFFLVVGLEIKREIVEGELSSIKQSMLPILAALGGMIVPALIYSSFNVGKVSFSGWGIPMATDIAFAVGIMGMLGNRVPFGLKVMLTALAIVDDLGAIVVIALFYTSNFSALYLFIALGIWGILLVLNFTGIKNIFIYLFLGIFLWYFTLKSGIHGTISGVLLAMSLPLGKGKENSAAENLLHSLHKPVSYIIMPLFALCNTGFALHSTVSEIIASSASIGIVFGLFFGKPIGIVSFSWISIKAGLSAMPTSTSWKQLIGAGFLGGIGFTMSIFIALLAFEDPTLEVFAKVSILIGSVLSGVVGFMILKNAAKTS